MALWLALFWTWFVIEYHGLIIYNPCGVTTYSIDLFIILLCNQGFKLQLWSHLQLCRDSWNHGKLRTSVANAVTIEVKKTQKTFVLWLQLWLHISIITILNDVSNHRSTLSSRWQNVINLKWRWLLRTRTLD